MWHRGRPSPSRPPLCSPLSTCAACCGAGPAAGWRRSPTCRTCRTCLSCLSCRSWRCADVATAAEIVDRLTAAGGRRTASRQAIAEVIAEAGSHFTAEEMAERVQHRFPSVNISTVYRTLDTLTDLGVVDHVHFGHGRAVYHLRDEAHQHLYCERCERVEE